MSKIFGIGLSKTGTTSLNKALELLGYRVAKADLELPEDFDAATHELVAVHFEQLDLNYPGSRFIYTIRDRAPWLRSVASHWRLGRKGEDREMLRALYGLPDWRFDRGIFAAAYERHHRRVMDHFAGREILVLDVCGGDGWEKLCGFLGHPIPPLPFPRKNVGAGSWRGDQRRLVKRARRLVKRALDLRAPN